MKTQKLDARGIAHQLALLLIVVGIAITGAFTVVLRAHHASDAASLAAKNNSPAKQSKLSSSASPTSKATVAATTTTPATTPASSPAKSTTTQTATKSNTSTTTPAAASTPAAAPAQTPLSALTAVIANLQKGISAQTTATKVTVPGPITDAKAQPIIFTVNGQTYFAYRQGQAANFNASAAQVAGTMAMVVGNTSGVTLTSAYLDKSNNLVDPAYEIVGFSTGGN